MRLRHIALGCALAGTFGLVALPPATALAKGKPRLTLTSPVAHNAYGAKVTLTVTLGRTTNRAVSLYAAPHGGPRTLLASGIVNAKGRWSTTYTITRATTFTAVFAGDASDAPTWTSLTLRAFARVADRLTGSYKTVKIGGISYAVFHRTGTLTLYAKVWPKKRGECLEPETEQYDARPDWDADTKYGCDKIDAASHDTAPFSLNQAVGDRYRIRADYIHSSSDNANLNAQGPWLYFTVVK